MPSLHWSGKEEAVKAARAVPYRPLIAEPSLGHGDPAAENLLIQGDNLDALKSLLPVYAGRVKCIFIDPPYNTKSAFEHYDDNYEHSLWLSMMCPRLELLRELLSEDGSIWVTIDDNEGHYLKVLMDEIFHRENFVSNIVWQKKYTISNDAKWLSENHDHILAYAKNKIIWCPFPLPRTSEMDKRYRNPDNHPNGPWKATPIYAKRIPSEREKNFVYTFKNGVVWRPPSGTCPRFPAEELARLDANNEIWFGLDGKAIPSRKTFLGSLSIQSPPSPTIWTHSEAGNNHEARDESKRINPADVFGTPKPEKLLQRIISLATQPGDLILDSFLGSATTAAVAHKMGLRWIGVEMGEHAVTHCAVRLRKVIDGEQGGISPAVNWQGGGGFRFCRLGEPVFDGYGRIRPGVTFADLARWIWYRATHQPLAEVPTTPLLGVHQGTAYYLLFNGILGDRRPEGGNVLTLPLLNALPPHEGPRVVYGEACRVHESRLAALHLRFRQLPYQANA